jgi:hypothetical protein
MAIFPGENKTKSMEKEGFYFISKAKIQNGHPDCNNETSRLELRCTPSTIIESVINTALHFKRQMPLNLVTIAQYQTEGFETSYFGENNIRCIYSIIFLIKLTLKICLC